MDRHDKILFPARMPPLSTSFRLHYIQCSLANANFSDDIIDNDQDRTYGYTFF